MDLPIVQTYGTSDDGLNCSPNITSTPGSILPPTIWLMGRWSFPLRSSSKSGGLIRCFPPCDASGTIPQASEITSNHLFHSQTWLQDADCGNTNHLVACRWLGLKENNLWTNDFNAKRMLGLDAEHWWRKIRSFSFLWLIIAWVFMIRVTHEKVPLWFQLKAAQWHRYFVAHLGFQLLFISLHGHRIEYFVGFLCYKLYKKTSVFL